MKKMGMIFTAVSLLVSVNALAVTSDSSWDEIRADYGTDVRGPQIFFGAGDATTAIAILDVCVSGDTLHTLEPKPVYGWVGIGKNARNVEIGRAVLSAPVEYDTVIGGSDKGRNRDGIPVHVRVNLSPVIDVYAASRGDYEGRFLFSKVFSVPACR